MYQEFIHEFLKIPGVLGVALTQEKSIRYLYANNRKIEGREKHSLIEILQQRITIVSSEEDYLEFQVMGCYAYSYKLNESLSFLVITDTDIAKNQLRALAAQQLKAILQKDLDLTIKTFKILTETFSQLQAFSTQLKPELSALKHSSFPLEEGALNITELLNALNRLSQFSSNYIGTKLTVNYWQLTRPNFDWLDNFQINRSAELVFHGTITETITAQQHRIVKEWVAAFIKKCSRIIQDLPVMIEEIALDETHRRLLLTPTNS
ncbi:hypothetical protein [Chroococcidiopsis sp. TS-821]|uniref:hypothetical protein n=1 Tax=Chroococcidiopsis sp. TS-821 TaxID=1378066 RepID=UPI0011B02826|nr:hypothetical protein [Chroococcidiopsis sp. TS-821]